MQVTIDNQTNGVNDDLVNSVDITELSDAKVLFKAPKH